MTESNYPDNIHDFDYDPRSPFYIEVKVIDGVIRKGFKMLLDNDYLLDMQETANQQQQTAHDFFPRVVALVKGYRMLKEENAKYKAIIAQYEREKAEST